MEEERQKEDGVSSSFTKGNKFKQGNNYRLHFVSPNYTRHTGRTSTESCFTHIIQVHKKFLYDTSFSLQSLLISSLVILHYYFRSAYLRINLILKQSQVMLPRMARRLSNIEPLVLGSVWQGQPKHTYRAFCFLFRAPDL